MKAIVSHIVAIALVETRRLLRDRTSFSLIVLVPVLQIILFGLTVNLNPKNVPVAIAGGSPSSQESVVRLIDQTGYFQSAVIVDASGDALQLLKKGSVKLAIELPDDAALFDDQSGDNPIISAPQVYIDGADAGAVAPAAAALERLVWQQAAEKAAGAAKVPELMTTLQKVKVTWLYNPQQQTSWTIMPGLMGVIVMISMLMLGALSFAREREQGTWETLLILPINSWAVLLGKLIPFLGIAVLQISLATLSAVWFLGIPLNGAPLVLGLAALLLAVAHLMLGFVLSALVLNQMQALQAAVAFYLPSMLLSGFMFPFSGMPAWAQNIGEILPLTHFVRIARDVMLRGINDHSMAEMVPIAMFTIVFGLVSLLVFRLRLD